MGQTKWFKMLSNNDLLCTHRYIYLKYCACSFFHNGLCFKQSHAKVTATVQMVPTVHAVEILETDQQVKICPKIFLDRDFVWEKVWHCFPGILPKYFHLKYRESTIEFFEQICQFKVFRLWIISLASVKPQSKISVWHDFFGQQIFKIFAAHCPTNLTLISGKKTFYLLISKLYVIMKKNTGGNCNVSTLKCFFSAVPKHLY